MSMKGRLGVLMKIVKVDGKSLSTGKVNEQMVREMFETRTNVQPMKIEIIDKENVEVSLVDDPMSWEAVEKVQEMKRWRNQDIIVKTRVNIKKNFKEESVTTLEEFQRCKEKLEEMVERVKEQMKLMKIHEENESLRKDEGKKINKPPTFSPFSGREPIPKNECEIETLLFQIRGARLNRTDQAVRLGLLTALRGGARELIEYIGIEAPLEDLIRGLEERYLENLSKDSLICQFYEMVQGKEESIRSFAERIEKVYQRLKKQFPEKYEDESLLRTRLFQGMNQDLRNSLRYLQDRSNTTYRELLKACTKAEIERRKILKRIENKEANTGIQEERIFAKATRKLEQLQVAMRPTSTHKKTEQKGPPIITSAGPFRGKRKPRQCWRCGGWGHTSNECRMQGNVWWKGMKGAMSTPRNLIKKPRHC